jgi:hypothetical protein
VVQVGAATGADPFAVGVADRFEGDEKVDLLDQDFFQVDLVVLKKNVLQFLFFQRRAAQVDQFLGKKDDIEAGVDLEFELFQAAYANEGNRGFDFALGLDALVFPFKEYLVIEPFQEKAFVFQQLGAVYFNGVVQRKALFRYSVDIDDHWLLFFQLDKQGQFYNIFYPGCQTAGLLFSQNHDRRGFFHPGAAAARP